MSAVKVSDRRAASPPAASNWHDPLPPPPPPSREERLRTYNAQHLPVISEFKWPDWESIWRNQALQEREANRARLLTAFPAIAEILDRLTALEKGIAQPKSK